MVSSARGASSRSGARGRAAALGVGVAWSALVGGADAGAVPADPGRTAPTCAEGDGVRILSAGHTDVISTGGEGKKLRVHAPLEVRGDLHVGGSLRVDGREVATQAHLAELETALGDCAASDARTAELAGRVEVAEAMLAKYSAWSRAPTFVPAGREELSAALEACALAAAGEVAQQGAWAAWNGSGCTAEASAFPSYQAPLALWNTSLVTDMARLFEGAAAFDGDVGGWDTGAVTSMKGMFSGAEAFDRNVGRWETGKVEDVSEMFRGAAAFDNGGSPSISRWDTRAVANMSDAFALAGSFAQDLSHWALCDGCNGGGAVDTAGVLRGAASYHARFACASPDAPDTCVRRAAFRLANRTALDEALQVCAAAAAQNSGTWAACVGGDDNLGIAFWDTRQVTNMSGLFFPNYPTFDGNIGRWDVGQVTDMHKMFHSASSFNADLSAWNTSSVTNMYQMFQAASSFNADLSAWNTSSVKSTWNMFRNAYAFTSDLSEWDTSSVTNMVGMFQATVDFNSDLSAWDTSSVTSMDSLFRGASSFTSDLSAWNTSSVTDMGLMFRGASSFTSDLSAWDTGSVKDMSYMFKDAPAFTSNLSAWDTSSVTDMTKMFDGAVAMTEPTTYNCKITPDPADGVLGACTW